MSRPNEENEAQKFPPADELLAAVMCRQLGLVTVRQADDVEVTHKMLARRVERGLIVVEYPGGRSGVYRDPAAPRTREQRVLAAVLAAGDGAFASHETAAWLWDLPRPMRNWALEVTTPLNRRPAGRGVRYHRSMRVRAADISKTKDVPAACAALTIVDLSSRWSVPALGKAADDAVRRELTSWAELRDATERLAPAPFRSKRAMVEMLARRDGHEGTESDLEDFVLDSLMRFGVRLPVQQHWLDLNGHRGRIDHCYPPEKLVLEALGYEWHVKLRERWDHDRFRGNELRLAGFSVLEFTSAFTDWQIAEQVTRGLGDPAPRRPKREQKYAQWKVRRDRRSA